MTDEALPASPEPRIWPPGQPLDPASAIAVDCPGCRTPWQIHVVLAGLRLRCTCGVWVDVPGIEAPLRELPASGELPVLVAERLPLQKAPRDEQGRIVVALEPGALLQQEVPLSAPMAPGSLEAGTVATRVRWTNRAVLEIAAMVMALVVPSLAIFLLSRGTESALLMPFASMVSGALVLIIARTSGPYLAIGWRGAPLRYFAEALGVAAGVWAVAIGWVALLRAMLDQKTLGDPFCHGLLSELGLPWTLFVIAITPALFEEIAFRGVLQGRVTALLGLRNGIFVTAACFAICHGETAALPIHFGLGVWLSWLRERSGSLLPGMVLHFTYNAMVVVAT